MDKIKNIFTKEMLDKLAEVVADTVDNIVDFISSNIRTEYLIALVIGICLIVFISLFVKISNKKKSKKEEKVEEIKTSEGQVYNPLKNIQQNTVSSNLNTNNTNNNTNTNNNIKKEKKSKKELKAEELFNSELQICINSYNQLYNVYYNEGYSVDLSQNSTLSYYTSLIQGAKDIEELKNISSNISFQTVRIIDEIKYAKEKDTLEKQRKALYDECVIKMAELKKLFKVLNLSGDSTIKEFEDRLFANGMFAQLSDYQSIYNDLIQNIEFIKHKYNEALDAMVGKNSNEIDIELIESLKLLNCNLDETDLAVIKKNYLLLVKKYHPDTNSDSAASIEMSSKINRAYTYIKKTLGKPKDEKKD